MPEILARILWYNDCMRTSQSVIALSVPAELAGHPDSATRWLIDEAVEKAGWNHESVEHVLMGFVHEVVVALPGSVEVFRVYLEERIRGEVEEAEADDDEDEL